MPAPTITALARGGAPPEPPEVLTVPLASSPGPWPLARAGVSVMPPFPAYLLSRLFPPSPPGTDAAPPPGLRAAGPVSRRARRCRLLLDRDLLVDQAEVD